MSEKIRTFVKSILIPSIISRKKSELQTTSDVALKEWSIHPFDNDGAFMMTICYKLKVALNVDGDSHTLSVFLKVSESSLRCPSFDWRKKTSGGYFHFKALIRGGTFSDKKHVKLNGRVWIWINFFEHFRKNGLLGGRKLRFAYGNKSLNNNNNQVA